ncbi:acyl-ACP--UDP-N-acetylglucosamine O-acyltransferase [Ramlibacter humi]|uniref:Acyl-[acyl-carrier-protein]--UDP-N-acetylglucosamine O-acyltransferase n=1 Tax=Ramlibacter humi TaxID=2530451 RepID=A0A4Z0CCZ4_9BURK|nr:acyl-ACP--UDP-N-acetylglucosamine O-acyltransferase [Ramlibacter humi]TFZ08019.1 acyl-ACP--UDP-N-acetylglucosamine O-acyltransferase [Ramlibacter humi]
MAGIHPAAIVDPKAQIDAGVTIGPFSIVGPDVKIGAGTTVGPHTVIEGRTTIGHDNRIFQFVSLGSANQDKKYRGEPTELVIGDRNVIREYSTYQVGTVQGGGVTRLGNDNWMMAYTHLAHDCLVGDNTIFANNAQIAGHVEVGDFVILGAYTCVHQFVRIGAHGMTAMGSVLLAEQPPFVMSEGNPAQARSMNYEGLRRRGFSAARVAAVKTMHKALYREGLTLEQATQRIHALAAETPEAAPDVQLMAEFLARVSPQRGIVR